MKSQTNTFSLQSYSYARHRPHYPQELFLWLSRQCVRRELAWDCACGNGQAAVGLAQYFDKICASDRSDEQIANSRQLEQITYSVELAEESHFADNSFDLIVVAQALHWFDYPKYWPEVARLGREDSFFCAWGYDWVYSFPEVDENLIVPFREILSPFWSKKNHILWNGYSDDDIFFPFERVQTPQFEIIDTWQLKRLIDYMCTWSAYKSANTSAKIELNNAIKRTTSLVDPNQPVSIKMPLNMVAGKIIPLKA